MGPLKLHHDYNEHREKNLHKGTSGSHFKYITCIKTREKIHQIKNDTKKSQSWIECKTSHSSSTINHCKFVLFASNPLGVVSINPLKSSMDTQHKWFRSSFFIYYSKKKCAKELFLFRWWDIIRLWAFWATFAEKVVYTQRRGVWCIINSQNFTQKLLHIYTTMHTSREE